MTPAPTTRPVVHLLTTRSRCSFASLSSVRGMEAWGSEQSPQSLARVSEAASDEGSRGLAMESCCVMASAMPELPSSALALTQASAKGRSPVPFRSTRFINATWSARSSRFWPKQIMHRSTDCRSAASVYPPAPSSPEPASTCRTTRVFSEEAASPWPAGTLNTRVCWSGSVSTVSFRLSWSGVAKTTQLRTRLVRGGLWCPEPLAMPCGLRALRTSCFLLLEILRKVGRSSLLLPRYRACTSAVAGLRSAIRSHSDRKPSSVRHGSPPLLLPPPLPEVSTMPWYASLCHSGPGKPGAVEKSSSSSASLSTPSASLSCCLNLSLRKSRPESVISTHWSGWKCPSCERAPWHRSGRSSSALSYPNFLNTVHVVSILPLATKRAWR
mmetsp:Transcript_8420/g.25274  ORF Transcript_8420/g.25274 Transcript_8420/m.25274 type:complete len:384 (-) Transcript_8420:804-1955(-)